MRKRVGGREARRLRVISGALRGRRLIAPSGERVRPTADKVREALFDILGDRVTAASFLDGYAGTGAVGIEALSRGASQVTFIENQKDVVDLLRANIESAGEARTRARVMPWDLARAIATLEEERATFDVVYLDPPYSGGELERALRLVARAHLLREAGTVVAEHESGPDAPPPVQGLHPIRTVAYGRVALTFFERPPLMSASR